MSTRAEYHSRLCYKCNIKMTRGSVKLGDKWVSAIKCFQCGAWRFWRVRNETK